MNKRCRRELKPTNGSWRVDETYVRVKGKWTYLYRAVDSGGATIDFLLTAGRDAVAAKHFFQKALRAPDHPRPRVINVDGNPAYPKVVAELKQEGKPSLRCRCRTCPFLINIVEQDHRAIKRRVNASQGIRSFHGARRTIQGYEVVHMIRKGQVRWLPKGDVLGLILFLNEFLGVSAE
jgi:transposase-like protein